MTNDECRFQSLIVCLKNPSKILCQIFLANANLNGLAIGSNQSRTSSKHFDTPFFQNPYKIMAEAESNHSLSLNLVNTHFDHLLCSATLLHFITMEYIKSNKGGRKLAFENNIYIKQKVLKNGAVCWECKQRKTANTCMHGFVKSHQPTIGYTDP